MPLTARPVTPGVVGAARRASTKVTPWLRA